MVLSAARLLLSLGALVAMSVSAVTLSQAAELVHDSEYYILEAQNAEQWAVDDKAVDAKLAAFKTENGGKPPNILYILIDDIGFGDLGIPELNAIRGYKTPNINKFSDEGMRFARMYTEPSCTPTRVAFTTGRQPYRMGMGDTAVDISGFGLPGKEVTLAEILSDAGYNTVHIGKWHMGDIKEAWPNFQGFDYAAFPIHQQGQLSIYNDDSANAEVSIGLLENALKFSSKSESPEIEVSARVEGDKVICCVADNGIGIDQDNIDHIFDYGKSYKRSSGLGLYYCKMFVEDNGGSLHVSSSESGQGTTVRATFRNYE